jgi:predicted transcriptional regulator YdeE
MKIVKYVLLLLLLAVIASTVFIATQDGKYDIHKEKVVKVPRAVLYNYINDYRNWENVGILTNNDTTAVFTYSANTSGSGAAAAWKVNGIDGKIQTIKAADNDSIVQKAVIDEQPSDISWRFNETGGGTKVTVRMKGELSFTDKAYAILNGGVKDKLESTLDKGLESLNNFLVHELSTYKIDVKGLVTKKDTYYIGQSATSTTGDVNKKVAELLPKLLAFIKENKIATNGSPFTIYKSFDRANNVAAYTVCVPIKEEIFTAPGSEIEGGNITAFNALKTTLNGDYSHLNKAWDAGRNEIRDKNMPENIDGKYIEVYTKNIQHTKKPSGWVTDIYIPVGPRTGAPEISPEAAQAATSANITAGTSAVKPAASTPAVKRTSTTTTTATKPAGTTTTKPAGTTTSKPVTTPKPGAATSSKPASGTATKPATSTTSKPAGSTSKPAAPTAGKPATAAKPKPTASKPASTSTPTSEFE